VAVKYQVFVSSTFVDLQVERDKVIQGILELGHIPVGMEMFSAADEEQWQIIARHIDESDYYVVILAHHYGSVVGEISYTRKEYEYALSRGVPIIGFIIDPGAPWPGDRMESDPVAIERLAEFKLLVEQKPVGYWISGDDLYGKSSVALVKAIVASPRVGWVRSSSALGPEVTAEISRLSAENASLRAELAAALEVSERENDLALDKLFETLGRNKVNYSVRVREANGWQASKNHDLAFLFRVLSPLMVVEYSTTDVGSLIALNSVIEPEDGSPTPAGEMIPLNEIGAILADYMALGIMTPSVRRHPVADTNEYWSLTELGRELAKRLSRKRLEHGNTAAGAEAEAEAAGS
jgi:hypothetical protein